MWAWLLQAGVGGGGSGRERNVLCKQAESPSRHLGMEPLTTAHVSNQDSCPATPRSVSVLPHFRACSILSPHLQRALWGRVGAS